MKISYCITVCTEYLELKRLLDLVFRLKRNEDDVWVQADSGKVTQDVISVIGSFIKRGVSYIEFPLNDNFADYKNNLYKNCSGDWCFFIDADEIPHENLLMCLPELVDSAEYQGIELMRIPRINTVDGITQEWIARWKWRITEIGEYMAINFPDYQQRLVKRNPEIHWRNKVHEVFTGYSSYSDLPMDPEWCLFHPKILERQIKQNEHYANITSRN